MQQNKSTIPVGNRLHHFLIRTLLGVTTLAVLSTACAGATTSIPTVEQPTIQALTESPFVPFTSLPPTTTILPPTATPKMLPPTATLTPLRIAALNPYLTGVGEHGAMICFKPADPSILEGIVLRANISQGHTLDKNVATEKTDQGMCLELIDAFYTNGKKVNVTFNIANGQPVDYDLGPYSQPPFLTWVFGDSGLGYYLQVPNITHPQGYDLTAISAEFPDGDMHPITAPCDGPIIRAGEIPFKPGIYNLWQYCTDTGYAVHLGHGHTDLAVEKFVVTGDKIGYITYENATPKNYHNGSFPHIHFNVWAIKKGADLNNDLESSTVSTWVDPFNPRLQIGGQTLPSGLFISVPQQVQKMIDNGYFKPKYDKSVPFKRLTLLGPPKFPWWWQGVGIVVDP